MSFEYCSECGDATGRAGAGEDSIYVTLARDWHKPSGAIWPVGEEVGPLCEQCYDRMKADGLIEECAMPTPNYNRCWLRCLASWNQPPAPKAEPAEKPKREPAKWRPMTDLEIEAATQLGRCSLPPATSTKRLCRHMAAQAQADEPKITDKQAEYLWKFCWTYRRQIASAAVVKEAKRRRVTK